MKNTAKTAVLLAGLGGLIMAASSFWGSGGLILGLAIALVMVGGSYWFSDKLAIRSARAVELRAGQLPEYWSIMTELTHQAGMPMPRLYISPDPQPNAFATGRNPSNAAVCITQGLVQHLEWYEIRGVLAHELAHIKNRDILIGSVAAAIATGITFAARMAQFTAIFGGGGRDDDRNPIAELALIFLAPIAAMVLQMAISRSREFQADRSAARMIGDGEPLARALEKLDVGTRRVAGIADPAQAQMYIANPLAGRQMSFRGLFSTHPAMDDRIRRLRDRSWA
ncbi:MAG: M48 family metalloprotease [Actinomycetia bacterium]|nr:M48 family metalloprotease [Actinomycetes bacterium]MCP4962133.1 M48 family metalloprotease [Actinomycetes bacterium]